MGHNNFSDFINRQGDFVSSENAAKIINKLLSEREMTESMLENIDEGLLMAQDNGKIMYANIKAISLLHIHEDVKNILQIDPQQETGIFTEAVLGYHFTISKTVSFYKKELQITVSPYIEKKIVVFYIADKTIFYKHFFSQHEHYNALNHIVTVLNHEIKTPLHAMSLDIELLQRKSLPGSQRAIDALQSQLDKITSTLDTFVHSFRKLPFRFTSLSIPTVIEKSVQILFYDIKNKKVSVEYRAENIPLLLGDESLLQELFMHIIRNAVESYTNGGIVHIETTVEDNYVITTVTDTGCGITPENIPRLFQPYFTTKPGSAGLGLSVVSQIVYNHLGKIDISSKPDAGTSVRIALPLRTSSQRSLPGADGDIT